LFHFKTPLSFFSLKAPVRIVTVSFAQQEIVEYTAGIVTGVLKYKLAFCQRKYNGLFNFPRGRRIGKGTGKDCRWIENVLRKAGNSP
jgi:hypothetical protein